MVHAAAMCTAPHFSGVHFFDIHFHTFPKFILKRKCFIFSYLNTKNILKDIMINMFLRNSKQTGQVLSY